MKEKNKILRKLTAALLLNVFSFNILADGLQVDPNSRYNTKLDMSRNGTPIVNISTPNGRGISINEFLDYNVGHEGQVLNNADNIGRSHLAGIINANPNLAANQAANLIILQVNGSNRSDIEGYLEALSRQKVNVILSNENGIYLNGAGTINIRNFVPTTGRVKLQNGDFVGIDVEKGRVVIGSNGFDASTTDYVNVIAKALELQGSLVGNKVDVTLGENTVDKNGAVTSRHGINSVAIDASKLGSMYAGQISIISTDKGAGVNSRGIVYSRDKKLEITADGKINVAKIKGNGIEINGTEYAQSELASSDKGININAKNIKLNGETQAAGDINLNGNTQNNSKIYSEGNFNTKSLLNTGDINVAGNFKADDFKNVLAAVNTGGNLNVKNLENSGSIQVSKSTGIDGKLNNSGNLTSIGKITVKNDILSSGNISTNGDLSSKNAISSGIIVANNFTTSNLQNDGKIFTNADLKTKYFKNTGEISVVGKISSDSMVSSGSIRTNENLDISGDLNNDGTLQSAKDITVSSNIKNSGKIYAGGNLSGKDAVSSGKIVSKNLRVNDLKNDGEIFTNEDLQAKNVTNTGKIASAGNISTKDLKTSGSIKSNRKVTVSGKLENDGDLEAVEDIKVSGNVRNTKEIATNGDFSGKNVVSKGKIISKNFESEDLDNDGKISSNENVKARNIKNTGEIQAVGSISGNDLKTSGKVRANRKITVSGELENGGDLESGKSLTVSKNIKNTGKIAVNEDISGKDTQNSGSMYSKNLKTDNLKNDGKVEVGNDLKTADIENTKDITAVGKISGGNVNNSGKILTNGTLDVKNVKNIGKIAAGSDVTSQRLENSGVLATNGNITTSDSMINSGNIEGKNLDITGLEFTNTGKISADNIRARVNDTKNDGSISSANDIDLTTNTLTNTKEMLAVNDINSNNATVSNSGKMASNGKILLNNSSITNIGEILSGEVSMQNAKKFDNTGTIKGNKTVLTTDQDLNLVGNLHGESLLEISGNNITNNGNTTGAGLIKISSNDFTNNKELASSAVIIDGRGNVVNNNMITGNDGKINGNNITNNDLIAFDNYLEMNAKSKVLNNKDKSIYGGNALIIKGSEILNDEGEILGGNMDLNASKITNNVGTVQSTGDIFVTSNDFQNIGRVTGLGNYEKYYETWDGIKLTEQEIKNEWAIDDGYDWGHGHYKDAIDDQKAEFEKFVAKNKNSRLKTYLLTKHEDFLRSKLGQDLGNNDTFKTGSALFPTEELTEKLKSNANTEYGKMIASGNIIINSGNVKNKDSLISGGGLVNINAANFENSVTIDTSTPIKLKKGYDLYEINVEKRSHGYDMTIFHDRKMDTKNFLVGYAAGQPSIIEGSVVNVNAPNIIKNPNEYGNGKEYENGGAIGKTLISSSSFGINKGTSSNNGQVGISANGAVDKFNSIFNGNSKVNGSSNNSFDRAIQISGNNSVIQNIKKTGTIDVNPLLSSAMFTMNMSPSSKYLLETRSKYISLGQYYGSDYFTSRVGYSEIWDRSKRLGDAFYENQLLTRALNEKLGTSFLNGKSNQELIQSMMDNAADEKARLGLVVGQALTQDQINALNEDIIWYVSKEVNGVSVLTPQIYLSSRTRESISDDTRNRIGGINGTYVKTKDFVNDGTKWGNGGVTYVEANTVRNETTNNLLSEISGDQTYINAVGNIENIGGKIKGNEVVALISENGKVVNDTTKRRIGYDNGRYDSSWHDEIASLGEISSNGTTYIKANEYTTTGGILSTKNMIWDVNKLNADALKLSGEDRNGYSEDNFGRYSQTTHLGAGIVADATSGRIGDMNLVGSTFAGGDTRNLQIGKVNVESVVNVYESESKRTNKGFMSSDSSYFNNHEEENVAGNLQLSGARIEGNLTGIGSNIDLGENTFVGGKLTTDSRELHNSFYEKNTSRGFSAGISHGTASLNYGKSSSAYDEKDTINAKSNLRIGDGSVLNNGAEITATNFEYGNIQINNGDVKYGARIDTRDVHTSGKSSGFTISAGINSPALDRAKQVGQAVSQIKNGDTAGGAMEAINAATGTIKGLADNQGTRQTNYVNGSVGAKGARDTMANSNFYANIGVNAGFTRSQSNTSSHTEGAAVTTLKPMNENSSIAYSNVNNITYQGTQAQGGIFIYNNVANIQKEAVELHNSYNSSSSSRGINAGATIGYGHKIQTTGNGGSISASQSNQNTVETVYANGNFKNVNEVHNNTGSMVLNGFNQEGGKVTGNIGKLVVESRQNTSTTTGSSSGMSLGISANGVPSSVNINGSRTNGDRAFVDNQSTFIVGEGSNLHVGTLENTGAVVGKEGNSTFKIDTYVGKDIQNHDTMKTTGGSLGISTEKPRITNVGFNQDSRDKQGITRNTVVGDVEIAGAEGSPINRDLGKANEVTKDTHSSTNINVESQTIEYATNPAKLKEDIGKAKDEIEAVGAVTRAAINTIGSKEKNGFLDFLRTERVQETVRNLGYIDTKGKTKEQIAQEMQDKYGEIFAKNGKKLEINFYVNSEVSQDDPNAKNKMNAAGFVAEDGSIWLNADNISSVSNFNLNSVFGHELTHNVTGKDTELLANFGEARASGFIEKAMDKGYLARTGGGLNWNSETLMKEQKDRLASYQDIEEKLKVEDYLFVYVIDEKNGKTVKIRDKDVVSKIEKEIKEKFGLKNFSLDDKIASFDLAGKKLFAENVASALEREFTNYKNATGDNKRRIGEDMMKRYGITSAELAVADTDASKAAKAIILKKSDIVADVKDVLLDNRLTNSQKSNILYQQYGYGSGRSKTSWSESDVEEVINGIGLKELIASSTDEIANRMRWQSQFFKDFYANNQRLTNRRLVVDEDDFVWYAGKDGKLSTRQTTWRKDELGKRDQLSSENPIKGVVSYVDEKKIQGKPGEKITIGVINNEDIVTKGRNEMFNEVWAGKDYKNGNALMEYIIDDEHIVTVKPKEDISSPTTGVDSEKGHGYLNSDGTPGKGSGSTIHINFNYKENGMIVEDYNFSNMNLTKVGKEKIKTGSLFIYGHELVHALHNQMGINEQRYTYYFYLDSKGHKHMTGEIRESFPLRNEHKEVKTKEEVFMEVIQKIENMKMTNRNNTRRYNLILEELNKKDSEIYKHLMEEIQLKLDIAKKENQNIRLNIPVALIKQEEFNTVGNPKMFENSKIIHKFPNLPTERGLEKENNFNTRAVYDGVTD